MHARPHMPCCHRHYWHNDASVSSTPPHPPPTHPAGLPASIQGNFGSYSTDEHIDRITVASAVPGAVLSSDAFVVITVERYCGTSSAPSNADPYLYDWQTDFLDVFLSGPIPAPSSSAAAAATFAPVATRVPCDGPGHQTSSFLARLPPSANITYFAVRAVFSWYAYQDPPEPAAPCPTAATLAPPGSSFSNADSVLGYMDVDALAFAVAPAGRCDERTSVELACTADDCVGAEATRQYIERGMHYIIVHYTLLTILLPELADNVDAGEGAPALPLC